MTQDRTKRKLTAILSADVVGYSRLMEEDEDWTIKHLEENRKLISDFIDEYKGRVVDTPGDNILAEFGSVTNAVECAVNIQQELKSKNANLIEDRRMEFRIGVNLGEVIEEDGRIYGSGVNIAARLEGLTEAGGVCISRRAYDHVKTQLYLSYEYLGEQSVKNISEPIRIYRVLMDLKTTGKVIGEKRFLGRISRRMAMAYIIVLICALAGSIYWYFYSLKTGEREKITKQSSVTTDVKQAPKTIAVLPFNDFSSESDQANFVDGLSEEILMKLEQIPNLRVIDRRSSFLFKGTNKTDQDIGGALGADYILRGSIRKAGDTLRIIAQLIKASDNSSLWSKKYDIKIDVKEILGIQEDIADNVADKLKLTLESLKLLGGTENNKAYELYLKAKGARAENNVAGFKSALELIDEAIDFDPGFALAYAFKAHNHCLLIVYGPPNRIFKERDDAFKAAEKAIELEPNLADGYIYLGFLDTNFIDKEKKFRKALKLMNNSLSEDAYFIIPFYLGTCKAKKAYELLEKIRRNDPLNQVIGGWYYYTYGLLDNRKQAEEEYKNRNELLLDGYSAWYDDSITIMRLGSGDVLSANEVISSNPINTKMKKYIDSPKQGIAELYKLYKKNNLSEIDLAFIARWAAYFGDYQLSLEAIEQRPNIAHLWFPIMKDARKTARCKEYVREIGLVDYWKEYGWPDNNICHPIGDDDFVCE